VQQAAYNVGQTMVPEFLHAGEESALEFVNGTVKQIEKEEKRLRQIGKNIGKPIGANIKAEIAQAVAEAIRAAEASRTAALAEISAREAAATASAVEQATAQSLARLIRNSDNRAGRNVQPVLA
jgi:galactose-1-phosphate uridylyltransferase